MTGTQRRWFALIFFGVPAMFHALAQIHPIGIPEPKEIHQLFTLINLLFGILIMNSKKMVVIVSPLILLSLHQYPFHGQLLFDSLEAGSLDFQSMLVLTALTVAWLIVIREIRVEQQG